MTRLPTFDGRCAVFFDFDGTLVDIAPTPDAVQVDPRLAPALIALQQRCGSALAIVSGRPVTQIDHFLRPAQLPVAGVHGAERRDGGGRWHRAAPPDLGAAATLVQRFVDAHPALALEHKAGSLALHYRGADDLAAACMAVMATAQDQTAGTALLHGKKVIELKSATADKGRAVAAFLDEAPFRGRQPWFFGDDVTDEAAFETVKALHGVTVKVGEGASVADWRLSDPGALRAWLLALTHTREAP